MTVTSSRRGLHSEIRDLLSLAIDGIAGSRSVLAVGTRPDMLDDLGRDFVAAADAVGATLVMVDCAASTGDPYRPLQIALESLLPTIHQEAPQLTERLDSELEAVHPSLAASLNIRPKYPLAAIANTPSERRSHRESERAFRIINGLARLLDGAARQCPSLNRGPVLVYWRQLQAADAATWLTYRRTSRWAQQNPGRLVHVATVAPAALGADDAPALESTQAPLLDWVRHRTWLFTRVREQSLADEYSVRPDKDPAASWPREHAEGGSPPMQVSDRDDSVRGALDAFRAGAVEAGCARAIRALAQAAFALDYPTVLRLTAHVIATAGRPGSSFDETRFVEEWTASEGSDQHPALEFAVTSPNTRRELIGAAWRAAGFANSCLGDHEAALACYREAGDVATGPQQRAQSLMYLGLITGKRQHRLAEATQHIAAGIAEVENESDPICVLELGWLLNVNALMAFSDHDLRRAMALARTAWSKVRPIQSSEATHLKVNLVSNISVLYEQARQYDQAVEVWQRFRVILARANELFAKHYHFREAGLRLKAGDAEGAMNAYLESLRQCEVTKDPFHAQIVAESCAYVTLQRGQVADAVDWIAYAIDAAHEVGNTDDVARLTSVKAVVPTSTSGAGNVLPRPSTKLNRPFDLVNVV